MQTTRSRSAPFALAVVAFPWLVGATLTQTGCNDAEDPPSSVGSSSPPAAAVLADAAANAAVSAESGADADLVDPTLNPDPMDLAAEGDPALDIAGSQLFFDNGEPWVRVAFFGAWPPPPSVYSWACSVLLGTQNAPPVTYTPQGNGGVQSDFVDGIAAAKVTYVVEPKGFRVRFSDAALVFDRYGLECSIEKTVQSQRVQDVSGTFVLTGKIQRPFGS